MSEMGWSRSFAASLRMSEILLRYRKADLLLPANFCLRKASPARAVGHGISEILAGTPYWSLMATEPERPRRLAILIDADNASPRIVAGLFEEMAALGEASVRRIYGDFSGTRLRGWAEVLSTHAIVPHQNFANTVGKNASDIALVIDAMDLLHTGRFDAFCIVSSDGDFTRLAARIREQGVDVFGFGEVKTPQSFRNACKRFIYTENLVPEESMPASSAMGVSVAQAEDGVSIKQPPGAAVPHIRSALTQLEDIEGWYPLAAVGTRLAVLMPDFDPRTYACAKLVTLIERSEAFEVRRENLRVLIRPNHRPEGDLVSPVGR